MQHVLDIDLDFFLADCCQLARKGERPPVDGCEPWHEKQVRDFLENNCGLSSKTPLEGRIFQTHDGALVYWHELIKQGKLQVPFCVTHVDAHSDLGIGKPGPGFVLNTVISTKSEKRVDISKYYDINELDEANYLLFALAFRWIDTLINVRNPNSRKDIPQEILHFSDNAQGVIRLESFVSRVLEGVNGKEPSVRYRQFIGTDFVAADKFDFVSFAVSPRYLPREADFLADIAKQYVKVCQ